MLLFICFLGVFLPKKQNIKVGDKMKKRFFTLFVFCALLLVCILGLVACNNNDGGTADKDILSVYNQYVAYAEEQGTTPLSYEEWLKTIKGEKGDKGDKGEKGDAGTNGTNGTNGSNGETPRIVDGYWWIGNTNTGVKAEGKNGKEISKVEFINNRVVVSYTDGSVSYFDVEMEDVSIVNYPKYLKNAPYYEYCTDLDYDQTLSKAGVKGIFFNSVPYKGKYTKVAAYIGYPAGASASNKVPAIVLVHGAGGTAMPDWVKYWNDLGYAAIAIDTEGAEPTDGVKLDNPVHNARNRYNNGAINSNFTAGPYNMGMRDGNEEVEDQWMYHASAAAMAGASILLDDERVDSTKLGITGISYGSMVTSVAISHDDRFNFAIPVYGGLSIDKSCSSFYNLYYVDKTEEYKNAYYKEMVARWDNLNGLENTSCKVYYITSTTDFAFSMDIASRCAEAANGYCNFKVGFTHDNTNGSSEETISAFANYAVGKESDFVFIKQTPTIYNNKLKIETYGNPVISGIKVLYTDSEEPYTGHPNGKIPNFAATWQESSSYRKLSDGEYEVAVPACKLYYVRVEYANGARQTCSYLMNGSDLSVSLTNNFSLTDNFKTTFLEDSNVFEHNHVTNHDANNNINYGESLQSVEVFQNEVQPDDGYIVYKLDAGEGKSWTNMNLNLTAMLSHGGGAYWYNANKQGGSNVLGANIYVEISYDNSDYQKVFDFNTANGNWITLHNHLESRAGATTTSIVDLTTYCVEKQVVYVRVYIMHFTYEEINVPSWGTNGVGYQYLGAAVDKVAFEGNKA